MSTVVQTLQGAKTYNKGQDLYSEGEPAWEAHEGNTDMATFLSVVQESQQAATEFTWPLLRIVENVSKAKMGVPWVFPYVREAA